MGTEQRRRALPAALAALTMLACTALPAAADQPPPNQASPSPDPSRYAAEPWWVPVGLRGQRVIAVQAYGGGVLAVSGGRTLLLRQGVILPTGIAVPAPTPTAAAGDDTWTLRDGRVLHGVRGGIPMVDPGSPDLGASAHLIAAPVALPGTVLAVAADDTVWRRTPAGSWERSLVLLPRTLVQGAPPVTGLAAFDLPSTTAVYLSTDGYSVLETGNGGADWIRAGPGLPGAVLGLSASSAGTGALYAATDDGVWVHHLRVPPAPPVYEAPALTWRWVGIVLVCMAAVAAAIAVLRRTLTQ